MAVIKQSDSYFDALIFGAISSQERSSYFPSGGRAGVTQSAAATYFDATAPLAGIWEEIKYNANYDKSLARRKIIRFGPKVTVRNDTSTLLRDKYLQEAQAVGGTSSLIADYEAYIANELQSKENVRGEGTWQVSYTNKDFLHPIKATKRNIKTMAKAHIWNLAERNLVPDERDANGNPKYTLSQELNEWNRVKGYLQNRTDAAIATASGSAGASAIETQQYLTSKKEHLSLKAEADKLRGIYNSNLRAGLPTVAQDKILAESAMAAAQGFALSPAGQFVQSFEKRFLKGSDITRFENSVSYIAKTNARLTNRVAPVTKWLQPRTGYLWNVKSMVDNPFRFFFRNLIWRKDGLAIIGLGKIKGMGLGDKLFKRLGVLGEMYKKGVKSTVSKGVKRVIANVINQVVKQGVKWAARVGLDSAGQLIGSVLPVIGNAIVFVVTEVIMQVITHPIKTFKRFFLGILLVCAGCLVAIAIIPIFIMFVVAFVLGVNPSQFMGGLLQGITNLLDPNHKVVLCGSTPIGSQQIGSQALVNYIYDIAAKTCVPGNLILAEIKREAPGTLTWTDAQFAQFSVPGWQNGASVADQKTGYCYNSGAGAEGPMQFLPSTFAGYASKVPALTGLTYPPGSPPSPCTAKDAIAAGALKMKADSGTGPGNCTNWDKATVYNVAGSYCWGGASPNKCAVSGPAAQGCGTDYCGGVYANYQNFAGISTGNASGCVSPGGPIVGGPHQDIVKAMQALGSCPYYPNLCLTMVQLALKATGHPSMSAPGSGTVAGRPANEGAWETWYLFPSIGYQQITLQQFLSQGQLPQSGDLIVWDAAPGFAFGHIGVVWGALTQGGQTYIYVISNLNCGTAQPYTTFVVQGNQLVPTTAGGVRFPLLGFLRAP